MSDESDNTLPDSDMETLRTCQDCGAVMPASHTGSICPKCVLGLAADPPAGQLGEAEGDIIGPYTLRQKIGEGGFGVVWMAEQSQPMSRMVALKVVKAGMDTKQVLARFEAEQQALALLDHPNIAKVLDAGATETGRPYFVMELVKGIPITQFCQEQKLNTKARLDLFRDVCSAINHAHQKGIIHRDLKPSNVMVTLHGDNPVAKVIDFGIAKATQQKLTDKTLFTRFEQFLGTPVYMSPEQAALSGLDIDTRSDIYSLGVLLYELLAGKPPFDPKTLLSKGYEEMRRIIREDEPPKPSTKLTETESSGDNKFVSVAPSSLKGELDWIIMKAIDKDRGRRYETANAFAGDIGRYLNNEPVLAAAPSAAYKFRKFARRNKAVLGVAAAMITLLLGGIVATSWQAVRATAERDRAEDAREEAEGISAFLIGMFESARPGEEKGGREVKVADVLDDAANKLETDLLDQPARRAKLQAAIGDTYRHLGLSREAILLQEQALEYYRTHSGHEHSDTRQAMHFLSLSYKGVGRHDEALKMQEEVLELHRKIHGASPAKYLDALHNVAMSYGDAGRRDEEFRNQEEVLELRREVDGVEHPDTVLAMINLSVSLKNVGRMNEALAMCEEVLELSRKVCGPEHPHTLLAMGNLAARYEDFGRLEEALAMKENVLNLNQKINGPRHPNTIVAMGNFASHYNNVGRYAEALELSKQVLEMSREVNGPEHPDTLLAMGGLAACYMNIGQSKEAVTLQERMLELSHAINGPEHPATLLAMNNLAIFYTHGSRREEALPIREQVLELNRKINGPEHPDTLLAIGNLASSYSDAGRRDEALTMREQVLELRRKVNGAEHPLTISAMSDLASSYVKVGQIDKALELREQALAQLRKVFGPEHLQIGQAMAHLANSYAHFKRHREALVMREQVLKLSRKVNGPEGPITLAAMHNLANSYADNDRLDEAFALREQLLQLRRKLNGPEHPDTRAAMHSLANSHYEMDREEEALTIYEELLDQCREFDGLEHPRTLRAMDSVANVYSRRDRHHEALAMREQVVELRRKVLGPEHPDTITAMSKLAFALEKCDRQEEALPIREEVLELRRRLLGVEHEDTLSAINNLANAYWEVGRREEALPMRKELLQRHRKVSGLEHPKTLMAMYNLANSYRNADRRDEALAMGEEVVKLRRKVLGVENKDTLSAMNNLAISYFKAGRREEALIMREEVLKWRHKVNGPDPDTLRALNNLAQSYESADRREEALALRKEALDLSREVNGPEHAKTVLAMTNLISSYGKLSRHAEVMALREELLSIRSKINGAEHPQTLAAKHNLANSYFIAGRKREALEMREEVLKHRLKVSGLEHTNTQLAINNLERSYQTCGDADRRINGYSYLLQIDPKRGDFQYELGKHLYKAERHNEAVVPLRAALTYYSSGERSLHTRVRLARSLQALKREGEANKVKAELALMPTPLDESAPKVRATLIPPDSEWRWLHPTDAVDPQTNVPQFHTSFVKLLFDDTLWKAGHDSQGVTGGFGYGDDWFTGVDIGKPQEGDRHSAYFRCRFTTSESHQHIELRCQRDDGLIVYLDGKEVARDNLPAGADTYQMHALFVDSNEQQVHRIPLRGGIASGEHVLAISLHNQSNSSSDLRIGGISLVAVEEPSAAEQERQWAFSTAAFDAAELREAGNQAVMNKRFADALTYFKPLHEMADGSDPWDSVCYGTLLAYLGDQKSWEHLAMDLAENTAPEQGDGGIKVIAALPVNPDESERLKSARESARQCAITLTEKAGQNNSQWNALARGITEFRAGNLEEAAEWLTAAYGNGVNYDGRATLCHAYKALVDRNAGRSDAAQEALKTGLKRLPNIDYTMDWWDIVFAYLALREAWELIEGEDKPCEPLERWVKSNTVE